MCVTQKPHMVTHGHTWSHINKPQAAAGVGVEPMSLPLLLASAYISGVRA